MTIPDLSQKGDSFNATLLWLNSLFLTSVCTASVTHPHQQAHCKHYHPFNSQKKSCWKCWTLKFIIACFEDFLDSLFFYFKDSVEQSYLLRGCRWLQPNVRHKYRWSCPAWWPFPGSFATSLFHSGDWTCWRNKRSLSLCRVLSASLWRVRDAVPVTAAAQEEKSPWILPPAGRQKGKPQTQQLPRDREPGFSLLSQA